MQPPLRPTHLLVNLSQLRRNVRAIRARVNPAKVLVMLKANAYGHGLDGVAPFIEPDVDYIGVAVLDEGIHLRELGLTKPILVAGGTLPEHVPWFVAHDLTLTVSHPAVLQAAEQAAAAARKPLKIHLKIDTGMERAGVRWYEADSLLEAALHCPHLDVEGIYTHFANSETLETAGLEKKAGFSYASDQLARFHEVLNFYTRHSLPRPRLVHTANSAAILNLPESYFDMVRPGVMFYGIYPDPEVLRSVPIEPAATWKSQVVYSKISQAGHPVSYGSLWVGDHPVRTVTVPCGYADGYFRRMTNQPRVIVNGRKYQQVGRICMDQFMVNLEADVAELGDEVILLGKASSGEQILAEDLAAWAGTNPYEVMTNIAARVPRLFVTDDQPGN
jgi:alanine racemase